MPKPSSRGALLATTASQNPIVPQRHHLDRRALDLIKAAPGDCDDELLLTREVAAWWKVSEMWLEIGRSHGYGPPFIKLSPRRVRYRLGDLLEFLRQRRYLRTTEYGEQPAEA